MPDQHANSPAIPPFERGAFVAGSRATRIGGGSIGGKAVNLVRMERLLAERFPPGAHPSIDISIPSMTVIGTEHFDEFAAQNGLRERSREGASDGEIVAACLRAELPVMLVGHLRALCDEMHAPLAVRSSSLLEDALDRPFAGVFATKMIPNAHPDPDQRFRELVEAVKLVYASVFFRAARAALRAGGADPDAESMAVIVQEVVGRRHDGRFYPELSGVARSYDFYPGLRAKPEHGVITLALGLGAHIVDGGIAWSYPPAFPKLGPPFASARAMLSETQSTFFAINMGKLSLYDPTHEAEFLVRGDLADAERDGTLRHIASTYDGASDRIVPGVSLAGPRVVDFAPLLKLRTVPVNDVLRELLAVCEAELGNPVEIEFAATLPARGEERARLGFLQVRPMVVDLEGASVTAERLTGDRAVVASELALGNGTWEGLEDVVYVRPEAFESKHTKRIAQEIASINEALVDEGRPYLLIGFGRWGSSDPWLGIPATWAQISGARGIVEATLPQMNVELSQASHFFHNVSSFRIAYMMVRHDGAGRIDWDWLRTLPVVRQTEFVRHVRVAPPLTLAVDGRERRAVVERST